MSRTGSLLLALALTACRGSISVDTDKFDPRDDASDTEAAGSDTDADTDTETTDTEEPEVTCPELTVSATSIEFSGGKPGGEYADQLTVTNDCEGEGDLVVAASLSGEAEFTLDGAALTLAPGESGTYDITFSPSDWLRHDATLTLATNDTDEASVEVSITGVAGEDADYDGYASEESGGTDCDDTDATIYEGAEDTWYDGVDSNCDEASDYDQDGDGHDSSDYGGEDCDDTDADINPDAEDTWYDGVDSDCDEASDYDQDGDGFDSSDYGGTDCDDEDSAVNPDAEEVWYDGVDQDCDDGSDYDQDGDGYDATAYSGEDCDDEDSTVSPDATETWNGVDDNCDDSTDNLEIDEVADAYLEGASEDYLGYRANLAVGDVDDDGDDELVVGAPYGGGDNEGRVYSFSLPDYASWSSDVETDAEAILEGSESNNRWGNIGRSLGDVDGDGIVDIVVGGNDDAGGWWSSGGGDYSVGVYNGGSSISGTVAQSSASVLIDEGASSSSSRLQVAGAYDLNGDGMAEVIGADYLYSYSTGSWWSYATNAGAVAVFDADGLSGNYAASDADWLTVGEDDYDYLGLNVSGGDVDGDGYDDLMIASYGDDEGGSGAGAIYLVSGASELSDSDESIEDRYDAKLTGDGASAYTGLVAPVLADVDNDGAHDLIVSSPGNDEVYVLFDASTLSSGSSELSDFDLIVEGPGSPGLFGMGLAAGDVDGDGFSELLVGASDESGTDTPSAVGMVYLFDGSELATASSMDEEDAIVSIEGRSRSEIFGQSVLMADVDADGNDDLIFNAPGYDSDAGRIYVLIAP